MNIPKLNAILLTLLMTATTVFCAHAQEIDASKKAEIDKALGVIQLPIWSNIAFLKAQTNVPDDVWNDVESKTRAGDVKNLQYIVWDKHFSLEELKAINVFYDSPIGKKLAEAAPQIMREFFTQKNALDLQQLTAMIETLKSKGYDTKALEAHLGRIKNPMPANLPAPPANKN